jgi:hypothetical protein
VGEGRKQVQNGDVRGGDGGGGEEGKVGSKRGWGDGSRRTDRPKSTQGPLSVEWSRPSDPVEWGEGSATRGSGGSYKADKVETKLWGGVGDIGGACDSRGERGRMCSWVTSEVEVEGS